MATAEALIAPNIYTSTTRTPESIRLEKAELARDVRHAATAQKIQALAEEIFGLRSITNDLPEHWTDDHIARYVEGAQLVALACAYESGELDASFKETLKVAIETYFPSS